MLIMDKETENAMLIAIVDNSSGELTLADARALLKALGPLVVGGVIRGMKIAKEIIIMHGATGDMIAAIDANIESVQRDGLTINEVSNAPSNS